MSKVMKANNKASNVRMGFALEDRELAALKAQEVCEAAIARAQTRAKGVGQLKALCSDAAHVDVHIDVQIGADVDVHVHQSNVQVEGGAAFSNLVSDVLAWEVVKGASQRNPRHRLGESGRRRIVRMMKALYNAWEAAEILNMDYSTVKRIFDEEKRAMEEQQRVEASSKCKRDGKCGGHCKKKSSANDDKTCCTSKAIKTMKAKKVCPDCEKAKKIMSWAGYTNGCKKCEDRAKKWI